MEVFSDRRGLWIKKEKGKPLHICNFTVKPMELQCRTTRDKHEYAVCVALVVEGETVIDDLTVPLCDLEKTEFASIHYKCVAIMGTAKVNRYIRQFLRQEIVHMEPVNKPYISELGWGNLDGDYVYLAGNILVGKGGVYPKGSYFTDSEYSKICFNTSFSWCCNQSVDYLLELMAVWSGYSAMLVANLLASVLSSLFISAGFPLMHSLYLCAGAGRGKTTVATLTSNIYHDESGNPLCQINLMTSSVKMQAVLRRWKDCCVVFDDLYSSNFSTERKKRESGASDIIRITGNHQHRQTNTNPYERETSSVASVITAEYIISGTSTLSRCITLCPNSDDTPDWSHLSRLQEIQFGTPTAICHFIAWVAGRYESIVSQIKSRFESFRRESEGGLHTRIREHYHHLEVALDVFLQYAAEVSGRSNQELTALQDNFHLWVEQLFNIQLVLLERGKHPSEYDYWNDLKSIYQDDRLPLSRGRKLSPGQVGFVKGRVLCLDPVLLEDLFVRYYGNAAITRRQIDRCFRTQGVLLMDESNVSTKKVGKRRYYHIPLSRLENG